jgi:indolepyruvate ferredoxin oxidoreductase alpha subunit
VQLAKKKGVMVTGDIGCYTLASAPPLSALDTCFCMGAAFSTAHGGQTGFRETNRKTRAIGVMGDSTFFHTGINSLMNIAYNRGNAISVILDNRITAMTGQQENPGTGKTLSGADAGEVSIEGLCKALGFAEDKVTTVDPLNASEVSDALGRALDDKENPYVIIAKSPCVLKKMDAEEKKEYKLKDKPLKVASKKCIACKKCLAVGCPAISLGEKAEIDKISCNGCGVCASLCPVKAIG